MSMSRQEGSIVVNEAIRQAYLRAVKSTEAEREATELAAEMEWSRHFNFSPAQGDPEKLHSIMSESEFSIIALGRVVFTELSRQQSQKGDMA